LHATLHNNQVAAKNQRADADAKAAVAGKAEVAKAEARLRKRQEEAKAAEAKLGRDRAEVERMRGERLALPGHWEKAKAAASQAGFAVHPLTEARNQAEWRALSNCLHVPHPEWFGLGRDVVEHGRYNRLELTRAWRIENPAVRVQCSAALSPASLS
jgi:hypothetical protein